MEEAVEFQVELGEAADTFDLEKTVCSHGLFMMSPNRWDYLSRSFSRPLRLTNNHSGSNDSVFVSISHPSHLSNCLLVRVYGTRSLSLQHQQFLKAQIVRMLRLSPMDELKAIQFRNVVTASADPKDSTIWIDDFRGGRVFRSPTLFEDMVKCILLCNCQWSRTLSMAKALCELQLELQATPQTDTVTTNVIPTTPQIKESNRKRKKMESKANTCLLISNTQTNANCFCDSIFCDSIFCDQALNGICETSDIPYHQGANNCVHKKEICNFPSPKELANLNEEFLAKRCGLGYRAGRIIKLAQGIDEGKIPLRDFEQVSTGGSFSTYCKLNDQLKEIEGFGPFTRANVLMCMGFYHVIPTDSETIRHLKQVHTKNSTIKTIQSDVEAIYGKYAPFQFLAYWAELWHFYNQRFGKLSEMSCSDYKLITASNIKNKGNHKNKKTKTKTAQTKGTQ